MHSTEDEVSLVNGCQTSKYDKLGKDLAQAVTAYSQRLQRENLPAPVLFPAGLETYKPLSQEGTQERNKVVELAQELLAMTRDPSTSLLLDSLQFHFCSCLKVVLDLEVGQKIGKHERKSAEQLAKAVGADQVLLVRIMRVVMTKYVFAEPEPNVYCHTPISWAMQETAMQSLLLHRLDEGFRSSSRQPDALRLSGYREPFPGDISGFKLAFECSEDFWEFIDKIDIERGHRFNQAMKAVTINNLGDIPNLFPFESLSEDGGMIVDVGGGLGQVSQRILDCNPGVPLHCVVQDRHLNPGMPLNGLNGDKNRNGGRYASALTFQEHNFFNPQPIKGAAAYFFRHIFHDWPDAACIRILKQIVPAMDAERSRILICDQIVNDKSPSVSSVLYDVDMMTLFGGKERTLPEFLSLLKKADQRLYIEHIKTLPESATTMLVVRLSS